MKMRLVTPTKLILPTDSKEVRDFLTYTDKSVGFQLSRIKQNFHFRRSDPEGYLKKIEDLKAEQKKCLLNFDDKGVPWTYSGLAPSLTKAFGWEVQRELRSIDPESGVIPWKKKPFEMRYYQKEAFEALTSIGHGAIELPTGSGKSLIIVNLLKKYPVKTLIITPFTNITKQLRQDLEDSFGVKNVGQFGDGRKKIDKLFTVANAQSVTKVVPGSK